MLKRPSFILLHCRDERKLVKITRKNCLRLISHLLFYLDSSGIYTYVSMYKLADVLCLLLQVVGRENGLRVMRQVDAAVLLIGLPVIPLVLILGK